MSDVEITDPAYFVNALSKLKQRNQMSKKGEPMTMLESLKEAKATGKLARPVSARGQLKAYKWGTYKFEYAGDGWSVLNGLFARIPTELDEPWEVVSPQDVNEGR